MQFLKIFEQLDQIISAITLAKPRPGLFVADIQHILVIATPLVVTIVGLSLKPSAPSKPAELSLYLTGLSIPTDGILFTSIHAHEATGRIFLLGSSDSQTGATQGNDLCEFEYRSEEGWFKKRCNLLNHSRGGGSNTLSNLLPSWLSPITTGNITLLSIDQERHLIYGFTKSGSIKMYSLGSTGQDPPNELASVSNVVREALGMCPSAGPLLDPRTFEVNGLHTIKKREGGKVALVLTTTMGVRLYFSHARKGYGYGYIGLTGTTNNSTSNSMHDEDWNPASLWLCHVRLPPRQSNSSQQNNHNPLTSLSLNSVYQPPRQDDSLAGSGESEMIPIPSPLSLTHTSYASPQGFFISSHTVDSEHDLIIVTAPDLSQQLNHHNFMGTANPSAAPGLQNNAAQPPPTMSEIASPIHIEGHAWAIAQSSPSSAFMDSDPFTGSPQEWLILSNMGINVLSNQRPVDTLAGLLNSMPGRDHDLALFWERFGRDQTCAMCICIIVTVQDSMQSNAPSSIHWGSEAGLNAKKLFFESSGRPEILSNCNQSLLFRVVDVWISDHVNENIDTPGGMSSSGADDRKAAAGGSNGLLASNLNEATLMKVQRELNGLRNFMDKSVSLLFFDYPKTSRKLIESVLLTSLPDMRTTGRTDVIKGVYELEQNSMNSMRTLLTQSIEAISFILLLIDHKLTDIISSESFHRCPEETRKMMGEIDYRELIAGQNGRECTRSMVKSLINQQMVGKSVDGISEILKLRCGTFCSSDDVLLYKAIEALNRVKECQNPDDRRNFATDALILFKKGAKHMTIEVLENACEEFLKTGFLDGIVELCLSCAKVWDPLHEGVEYWRNGKMGRRGKDVFEGLERCYTILVESLDSFGMDGSLNGDEVRIMKDHAIRVGLSSDDELFHYHYYDWLLARDRTIELLETRSEYLESYLKAVPTTLLKADLLWQYYARQDRFLDAARILANLASDDGLPLPLSRRIEYLSLAINNAKSSTHLNGEGFEFVIEIEEKLEVGQVQVEVLQNIIDSEEEEEREEGVRQILDQLQRRLYTISELYRDVVEPLGLLDATLMIFHVSDHRDEVLTETVWRAIIERAHNGRPAGKVRGPEAVASKVTELGRKFYPSDIAFNLPMVVGLVEKYAFEQGGRRRWVGQMLRLAGVPWQSIWESMDELFTTKVPPWHVNGTLAFLAYELAGVLEAWLEELHSESQLHLGNFPAARVVDVIDRYVAMLSSIHVEDVAYGETARKLEVMKIRIRETF
ncbi:uncharacterized protein MELLADRAFT_118593 [Melampsora larici-populina 98AG31]|uniref:Nucleoporin Nup133/Nup155-like C-terminal domain-containing protein n=1 Tax=Melampsora larici-populina (strain 98AG31 / pathotype 3-4-7) TaxID=747676 RepID=F4SB33_MELLP|nr:uncharacterized protein MELLADRAFT_118593 [Melampsora larici-populina 98AG31]EGF98122.1 hypothetical protein MELLADRAFT_118593 [Melampsora larici-populina 98AG31]